MLERLQREFELVQTEYGDVEIGPNLDWVLIKEWLLPTGWNKTATQVLVLIPPGYPITPPDNFYTDNELRLASGGQPGNSSPNIPHLGKSWLQFSYHVEPEDWKPHADLLKGHNLFTFLKVGIMRRLSETN